MYYASDEAKKVVLNTPGYTFNLNEPGVLGVLSTFLKDPTKVSPRTIYNYMFYRLLNANKDLMRENVQSIADRWMLEDRHILGRQGLEKWRKLPRRHPSEAAGNDQLVDIICASENAANLWYINARFFVEELLPSKKQRADIKREVAKLISNVLAGFQVGYKNNALK
jgi:hypothetical protein